MIPKNKEENCNYSKWRRSYYSQPTKRLYSNKTVTYLNLVDL